MSRAAALAVLAAALAACDHAEPAIEQAPETVEQSGVSEPTTESTLYEKLAAARGFRAEAHTGPDVHYFFRGQATFRQVEGEKVLREVSQPVDIVLGGADRVRYSLQQEKQHNVFLLESRLKAWIRTPQQPEYTPQPADELARDTWIRWTVARFPWDFREAISSIEELGQSEDGRKQIALEGPLGPFTLILDEDLRPAELQMESVHVEFGDGRILRGTKAWMPFEWTWRHPKGRTWEGPFEVFQSVSDRSLVLDRTFSPPQEVSADSWITAMRGTEERGPSQARDFFGIVRRKELRVATGPEGGDWRKDLLDAERISEDSWLRIHDDGRADRVAPWKGPVPASVPDGIRIETVAEGEWLRWATWEPSEHRDAAKQLEGWAAESGYEAIGPVWYAIAAPGSRYQLHEFVVRIERL